MGGNHARQAAPETRRMRQIALATMLPLAVLTLIGVVWLWPGDGVPDPAQGPAEEFKGTVTEIQREECAEDLSDDVNGCGQATVELDRERQGDKTLTVELPNGPGAPKVSDDDKVVLIASDGPDGTLYSIVDHQRSTQLWALCIAFVLALLAFGRWRGLTALVGLVVTFGVLLYFVVPAILAGEAPINVAIVGAAVIALTVLYLTHGLTLTTTVAVVGTLASLALTGLLSLLAVRALHLSGITDDISTSVNMSYGVDMEGLLVASIIIGSLGVLDDVTVTQATTVDELAAANPGYGFRRLYGSASRVGRSHIASVVNTIILAYAGSSLPVLILIAADNSSLGAVVSTQFIAQELVRSAVATIGLIAAVPMTTALASVVARKARRETYRGAHV